MLLQECIFRPRSKAVSTKKKLEDEVQGLVSAWIKNGQIWGEELWGWKNDELIVTCWTPCRDSLNKTYAAEWVRKAATRVHSLCREAPTTKVIAQRHTEVNAKSWRKQASLYLFTHMLDDTSPICGGRTGVPIPLYLISIDQQLRQNLISWMQSYKHVDSLWTGSGPLEMEAYRELARTNSTLTQKGRQLASNVEASTKLPTYYYLMKYWGHSITDEIDRKCPGCGQAWKQSRKGQRGLDWFDYRCEPCRLVSHLAVSFDDARRASIGEWKAKVIAN